MEIQGAATNSATVLVNGQSATRQGEYFRAELTVDNTAPVWLSVTNLGLLAQGTNALAATTTGQRLIPPATQAFTYDADGNQLTDGLWTNIWNAENRVLTTESVNALPAAARRRETWSYLPDGRWSQRVIATNNGTAYFPASTNRYVWDGTVLLAVLNHTNGVVMTFLRGLDMSGSLQGAGGVGGVLAVSFATNGTHFDAYDGNGNVMGLVAGSNSTVTATYEYAAFGETLRASGPAAQGNPIQFSTQYRDEVTERVKYLYRDYEADGGRWKSRDPIGERGEPNLYGFVYNKPVNSIDMLGMWATEAQAVTALTSLAATWSKNGWDYAAATIAYFAGNPNTDLNVYQFRNKVSGNPGWRKDFQAHLERQLKSKPNGNFKFGDEGLSYINDGETLCEGGVDQFANELYKYVFGYRVVNAAYQYDELFFALKGSHYNYYAVGCKSDGYYSVKVKVFLFDPFTYPSTVGAFINSDYDAAQYLERTFGYGLHIASPRKVYQYAIWSDKFTNIGGK